MLPIINKNDELTQHLNLNPSQALMQPKKKQRQWSDDLVLLNITTPQIVDNPKSKKIFKLRFMYKDKKTAKKHSHVVYFGQKDDFIFKKDKAYRVKKILKMKNIQNPFKGDYWSAHLANKYETLKQGLQKFTQYFLNQNKAELQQKEQKSKLSIAL